MIINKVYFDFRPKADVSSPYSYSTDVQKILFRRADINPQVVLPAGIKRVRGYAFNDCWPDQAMQIVVPEGCTTISDHAFSNADIDTVTLPSTITSISSVAFTDSSPNQIIINKKPNTLAGYPWGADNEPIVTWKG